MNRNAKLLQLGQQKHYEKEKNQKRKIISTGKENPVPSQSKKEAVESKTKAQHGHPLSDSNSDPAELSKAGQLPIKHKSKSKEEAVERRDAQDGHPQSYPNSDQEQCSKAGPPLIKDKIAKNISKVQRKLKFESPTKSGLGSGRGDFMSPPQTETLISRSAPHISDFFKDQNVTGEKASKTQVGDFVTPPQTETVISRPPPDKNELFKDHDITDEKAGEPFTLTRQEMPKSKAQRELFPLSESAPKMRSGIQYNRMTNVGFESPPSSPADTGCSLLEKSNALSNILDNYTWTDEDTAFTDISDFLTEKCSSKSSQDQNALDDSHIEPSKEMVTPCKSVFMSFSSDCLDEADSIPHKENLSLVNDSQNSRISDKSSPLLPFIHESGKESTTKDDGLINDIQNAGIDTAEELIIMPLSPLNNNEDSVPGEEVPSNPPGGFQEEEDDQADPDDPDFVPDNTAPENYSGLDSDAGSTGESPKPRRRNPSNWKKNKRKQSNNLGQKHINSKGKEKPAREVIPEGCGDTCRRKCNNLVTLEERKQINKNYWSIGDCSRQWDYLSRHVRVNSIKRRTVNPDDPYRNHTYTYFFTVGNEQVQVCQKMFLKTFNISSMRIRMAIKKMLSRDGVISPDKRGRTGKKRVHPSTVASVVAHIESFPTYESHYTRRSSKKRYLDEKLNVSKMYRMYKASRPSGMAHTATARQYEDIFRNQYKHKLGFYKPKKDQCGTCLRWNTRSAEEKLDDILKSQYEKHVDNKVQARKIKDDHIALGANDTTVCVASFDLQKVFFCPHGENGEFIFRRKLRCYNLSIFQSVTKIGYCYVWDETTAKKGAIEVSSCVWSFIEQKVSEGYTKFFFVSDNCWNQNKNSILFAMYNMASIKFNIEISHTYMEKGHTQMECDSIHSLIERRCKNLTLCTPQSWYGVIRTAKVPDHKKNKPFHPYVLKVMTKDNIFDFKAVMSELNLAQIPKSKVRQISISQNVARFKRDFDGPEEEVKLTKKRTGRPVNFKTYVLKPKYSSKLPLKAEQLKDLLWLCDQKHIPEPDCQFYYRLAQEMQDNSADDNDESAEENNDSDEANETVDESESDNSDG